MYSVLFSQVQIRLVMIHFWAVAGGTKVGPTATGQVARSTGALLVFLPLAQASHPLTPVSSATMIKERIIKTCANVNRISWKIVHTVTCLNDTHSFCTFYLRLWFFWLHERYGSHGSHGSHDNHGQSRRWRLYLFLFLFLRGRRWRRGHGQLPLCVHFHQNRQRQKDHY